MDDWDGPGPDDFSDLWTATIVLPHVARLNDDDMDFHFPEYDGRWSRQTRDAMEKFCAAGLELNTNWALTRQKWSCEGCGRWKGEIFRPSAGGILLAKLELHHDHMWERANRRPAELLGPDWKDFVRRGSTHVLETIRDLVTRFNDALVCSECNAADGVAKRRLGIDPRFSFAVDEIRQFVTAAPHVDHSIDFDKARVVWETEKSGFERRVALLEMLVDDLLAGCLQRRTEGMHPARPMWRRLDTDELLDKAFRDATRQTSEERLLGSVRSDFLTRSVQKDVAPARKARSTRKVVGPTDGEYASYVPRANPEKWAAAGEDWSCPCCGRGKRAVLRMSSKKQWSGSIRTLYQFEDLLDEDEIALRERLLPGFANEFHVARRREVDVCSDCAEIGPRLQQERRDVGEVHLTLQEMKSVLKEAVNHRRHEIDMDEAERLSRGNGRYLAAAQAMDAFESLKASFRTRIDHARRNPRFRRDIYIDLHFLLRVEHRMEDEQERKDVIRRIAELSASTDVCEAGSGS
jgi:hypothetical protein